MPHKRDEIRDRIEQRVKAILPALFVFKQRYLPITIPESPALNIHCIGDTSERSRDDSADMRKEEVHLLVYCSGKELQEDLETGEVPVSVQLDTFLRLIETEFGHPSENLNGAVRRFVYFGSEIRGKTDGDEVDLLGKLKYQAEYLDYLSGV